MPYHHNFIYFCKLHLSNLTDLDIEIINVHKYPYPREKIPSSGDYTAEGAVEISTLQIPFFHVFVILIFYWMISPTT